MKRMERSVMSHQNQICVSSVDAIFTNSFFFLFFSFGWFFEVLVSPVCQFFPIGLLYTKHLSPILFVCDPVGLFMH